MYGPSLAMAALPSIAHIPAILYSLHTLQQNSETKIIFIVLHFSWLFKCSDDKVYQNIFALLLKLHSVFVCNKFCTLQNLDQKFKFKIK